jgi:O-antigen ligase
MPASSSATGVAVPRWVDWVSFGGLLTLALWLALPLGSRQPWAVAFLAMSVWGLLSLRVAAGAWVGEAGLTQRWTRGALPAGLLFGVVGLAVGQSVGAHQGWALFTTIDLWRTQQFALQAVVMLGFYLLVISCVTSQRRAMWVLGAVVLAGTIQALLAVGLRASSAQYVFLFNDFYQGGRVTGSFVNSDHLAGYLELCLSAGVGVLIAQFAGSNEPAAQGWEARSKRALDFMLSTKMLLRLALVVGVVALVMTHSRMGNGAFFASLLLVGLVVCWRSQKLRKPALWLVGSMAVIDLLIIGQWVGLDRLVERMHGTVVATKADAFAASIDDERAALAAAQTASREESLQDRLELPFATWPLVEQRPWFGHGAGTFRDAVPTIKVGDEKLSQLYWDYAHNDYIQTAIELGLVGLALCLALAAITVWQAVRLLHDQQPPLSRGVGVAALMGLCCMGLHSWVDFNLQIAANAATLTLLIAVVWAVPVTATKRRRSRSSSARSSSAKGARPTPEPAAGAAA